MHIGTSHPLDIRKVEHGDAARRPGEHTWLTDRLLAGRLAAVFAGTPLNFALWDGSEYGENGDDERICVQINDRTALYRFAFNPEVQFGDLYSLGRIDVDGDLVRAVESAYAALDQPPGRWYWLRRIVQLLRRGPSVSRSKHNIHCHYDIGNEFYQLWLDRVTLQYTCAYYRHPDTTLEDAQVAKLDHVCRKLYLKPADTGLVHNLDLDLVVPVGDIEGVDL